MTTKSIKCPRCGRGMQRHCSIGTTCDLARCVVADCETYGRPGRWVTQIKPGHWVPLEQRKGPEAK